MTTVSLSTSRRPGPVIAVLAMTGVIATGIQTLVVPLIGQLPAILGASPADTAWVITITLLTSAIAVPICGRLGDILGKRRVVIACLLPLLAGSVICALANSLAPMIVGRGLQGLGLAVVPLGISLLRDVVPAERMASAVATMSASMGIGGALGLPFAAIVGQTTSWRMMLWTFAGLAAVALVLVVRIVPAGTRPAHRAHFDTLGALWLSAGLVGVLLAVSKGSEWRWTSGLTLGVGGLGVLALGLWVVYQLRHHEPLVNVRSMADRRVALTNLAALLISFSTYPLSYVIPQILQLPAATGYGLGQSMLQMALWLAPGGLSMLAIAPLTARMSARFGARITLATGALVIAVGYLSTVWLIGSVWGLMVVVMICNIGLGTAYAAIPLIIMDAVPVSRTASANGFNTLCRAIGTSTAGAVIGGLLASSTNQLGSYSVPSLAALHTVLLFGCAVGVLASLLALGLPSHRSTRDAEPDAVRRAAPLPDHAGVS